MAHVYQERYSKLIAAKLNASLVTKDHVIFNTYYEGDPKAGAVKIPVRNANPEVASYSKTNVASNSLTYGSTAYITATLDNDKFVNEYIDGYEAAAVPDGIVADRLSSAGYALAATEDADALGTLVKAVQGKNRAGDSYASTDPRYQKAGTVVAVNTADGFSKSTAYGFAVDLAKALDEKNVPQEGRFLIVDPTARALLLQDDNFIRYGDLSQQLKETGAIGQAAGMAVYLCNRLGNGADITIGTTAYTGKVAMLAGHPDYCTRVDEWLINPHLVDLDGDANVVGGSAVKGRWVFTHEVTSPEAFAMLTRPVAKS